MSYRLLKYGNRLITGQGGGGVEFPHVRIGNLDWMTVNLAIDDGDEGIYRADNVVSTYGGGLDMGTQYYYTHEAAMRVAAAVGNGWRYPTKDDVDDFINAMGGYYPQGEGAATKLKTTSGWGSATYIGNGTDELGFHCIPAGYWRFSTSSPDSVSALGYFSCLTGNERYPYGFCGCLADSTYIQRGNNTQQDLSYGCYPARLCRDSAPVSDKRLLKKEV